MIAVAADALVVAGVAFISIGVLGLFRMPDVYTQLHASGKAALPGVILLLVASLAAREADIAARSALIALFLVLSAPVAAHVVARAAFLRGEPLRGHESIDESGRGLDQG